MSEFPLWPLRASRVLAAAVLCSALSLSASSAVNSLFCLGEYQLCNGTCVMLPEDCGKCPAGGYLCPSDRTTCVSDADSIVTGCPVVKGSFWDWQASVADRVEDAVSSMALADKVSLLVMISPEVASLSIPAYNWWTEAQHGVGVNTLSPASSGPSTAALACSFNTQAMSDMAHMSAVEARARHNAAIHSGDRADSQNSLTLFSPEINLVRMPTWGRVQESMGEDPLLTARMAAAFVQGLQNGDDPRHLLTAATCKDFLVYDAETDRTAFHARLTVRDLWETYLPPFQGCVDAGAGAIMGSYFAVGLGGGPIVPMVANGAFQNDLLRGQLGWDGVIMCDCDAVLLLYYAFHWSIDLMHAAVDAITGGTDLELNIVPGWGCGGPAVLAYEQLPTAVQIGLLNESVVDTAAKRVLSLRMRLGMFDPPTLVTYNDLNDTSTIVLSPEHVMLTRNLARQSLVLLQNKAPAGGAESTPALPLLLAPNSTLALIGPAIFRGAILLGDYADLYAPAVSLADAAAAAFPNVTLRTVLGCASTACFNNSGFADARAAVAGANAVLLQLGLCSDACDDDVWDPPQEAEGRDRPDILLPGNQTALAQAVRAAVAPGTPIICILVHGGVLALEGILPLCDAILSAGYPGMQGAPAIMDAVVGAFSPAGRTALTWYSSDQADALPVLTDMDMYSGTGRTYRFFNGTPTFPFGFGLTYTTFAYGVEAVSPASPLPPCTSLVIRVNVSNTGGTDSDEVVQVYVAPAAGGLPAPRLKLADFVRTHILAGASTVLTFTLAPTAFAVYDDNGTALVQAGAATVYVGGGPPGAPSTVQPVASSVAYGTSFPVAPCA